jgi:hypothetical protein
MKTRLLTLICMLTISASTFAGTDLIPSKGRGRGKSSPKISIGLSVGAGLPMGNYGKSTKQGLGDSTLQGYAKTGIHFNLNFGYKFTDMIGVMIMAGGNLNGYNGSAFDANVNNPAGTTVGTSHYIGSYLLGPFFNFAAGDKLTINVRILAGLMTASYSTVTETFLPGSLFQTSTQYQYGPAKTLGYDGGAGLTFNATDMVGISLGADYLGGTPVFTTFTETYSAGNSTSTPHISTNHARPLSIGIVNVSLGLVLRF